VQPSEDEVVELVDAHDELIELLAVANPTASASADDPAVESWCGIRGADGRLVACAANRPYVRGIPHLASVATHPDERGRGLGRAVTAWLTRTAMARTGSPVTTLGMYSQNEPARSVYLALGFHPAHRFTSGTLPST
jgi:predicted GNAT family acetyltransferase